MVEQIGVKEGKNASLIISTLTIAIITQSLLRAATIVFEFIQINFIILANGIPLNFLIEAAILALCKLWSYKILS